LLKDLTPLYYFGADMQVLGRLRTRVELIYAGLYLLSLRRWHGDSDTASFTTATALAGAVMANVLLVYGLVTVVFDAAAPTLPRWAYVLPPFLLLALTYALLVRNGRFHEVAAEFERRPAEEQRRARVLGGVYLAVSYLVPIVFGLIMVALTT
jgi:hypothetical protein